MFGLILAFLAGAAVSYFFQEDIGRFLYGIFGDKEDSP
jgi:hypothetical protein